MVYYLDNNNDELLIGTIDFNTILDEEGIDKQDPDFGFKTCEVFIWKKEGFGIPHIHIKNENIDTCVCIYKAYYFLHGESHVDMMNNDSCKKFNEWLKKPNKRKRYEGYTNWEVACLLWKGRYSNPVGEVSEQPDYTKLNENGAVS